MTEEVDRIPGELPELHLRSRAMGKAGKIGLILNFVLLKMQLDLFGKNASQGHSP